MTPPAPHNPGAVVPPVTAAPGSALAALRDLWRSSEDRVLVTRT